ncbi:hypothetical protein EMIT0P218_11103 [Pseudomonas sp. IT-P218]
MYSRRRWVGCQAGSHNRSGTAVGRWCGCQAVIAGKPAPTVDRVQPWEMGRLSGRAIASRLAPTVDRVRPWEMGRL